MQGGSPLPAGLGVPPCRGKTEFGSSTVNFAYFYKFSSHRPSGARGPGERGGWWTQRGGSQAAGRRGRPGQPADTRLLLPGQKLFSCHVCSNAFSTKGSLKVHMRLHTGAKPFKCPHCELRFRTSGRRKTHMQFHYKPDPKKARKPGPRGPPEGPQPMSAPPPPSSDPSVFIMNSPVLAGQLDQSLLQQGLLGQAVLPASVSGE